MRKINKLTPLDYFNNNNYKNICTDWNCFHNQFADIFQNARLQILTDEQNGLCGYTEIYINELEECHIDHYKKRAHFPNLTFNWDNLIVATKDNNFGANFKDNKYNTSGIQISEYVNIYNPVINNIKFQYTNKGKIIVEEVKIKKTVDVFNLNHESLSRRREDLISLVEYCKNDGYTDIEIKEQLETSGFISVISQELEEV